MWALCAAALALYLVAAFQLEPIVRWLWPIPVAMFVVYPYLKRVTWLCHLWLGACTGLAPLGAWLAVTGSAPWEAWALFAAQGLWVAGFDLFYSLFDLDARPGRRPALVGHAVRGARGVRGRAALPRRRRRCCSPRSASASAATSSTGSASWRSRALLVYEHSLVRPGDLRRLDAAFFTVNGVISVVFFVFVVLATTSDHDRYLAAVRRRGRQGAMIVGDGLEKRYGRKRALRGRLVQRPARAGSCSSPGRTARARRRSCGSSPGSPRRQKAR